MDAFNLKPNIFNFVIVALALSAQVIFAQQALRNANMTVTPNDVAWACDVNISKIDISNFNDASEIQLILTDDNAAKSLATLALDPKIHGANDVLTIATKIDNDEIAFKMRHGGNSNSLRLQNCFDGTPLFFDGKLGVHNDRSVIATESIDISKPDMKPKQLQIKIVRNRKPA